MCAINILLILTKFVQALSGLMHISFLAQQNAMDTKIAETEIGKKLRLTVPSNYNAEQSRREASAYAQKAFLLMCDCIIAPIDGEKDLKYIRDIIPDYIELLGTTANSIPGFIKTTIEPSSERMFNKAIERLEELEWLDIKNSLIVCWSQIFQSILPSNNIIYTLDSSTWIISDLETDQHPNTTNNPQQQ